MKRRKFIKTSAAISAGALAMPGILKSTPIKTYPNESLLGLEGDNVMIILELFGGNDGLNTIIPIDQEDEYVKLRPRLNIPANEAVRFGTSDLFFNKALVENVHKEGFLRLMDEGRLAIVNGVGYENPNLSHFRSRDIWHTAVNDSEPGARLLEGWLGRYLAGKLEGYPEEIPEHPIAISLGGTIPLALKSSVGHMGIAFSNPEDFIGLSAGLTPDEPLYDPADSNHKEEFNFIHTIARQSEEYSNAVRNAFEAGKDKIRVDYTADGLSQKFKIISTLIAGGLKTKIYYLNLSNFDSHAKQMSGDYLGAHADLLSKVARAVSEFLDDAVQIGYHERVAGMTVSEFGRRAYDNGSRGTDHGAASVQFVFAGSEKYIEGGYFRQEGKPNLSNLDSLGNIRHDYDFRRVYTDFLENWLGSEEGDVEDVFGQPYQSMGILKRRHPDSVSEKLKFGGDDYIRVYPNPNNGEFNMGIELKKSGFIKIRIFSIEGRLVTVVHDGYAQKGGNLFRAFIKRPGNYLINFSSGKVSYSVPVTVLK